jgi:hypothetical protein
MSPAGLIVMQTHHSMADGTLRIERVKSPSSQKFDELENPHGENAHGRLVVVIEFGASQQLTRAEVARARTDATGEDNQYVGNLAATLGHECADEPTCAFLTEHG